MSVPISEIIRILISQNSMKERLAKSKDNSKAVVAAASKLLKIVYWIIKERREYVCSKI